MWIFSCEVRPSWERWHILEEGAHLLRGGHPPSCSSASHLAFYGELGEVAALCSHLSHSTSPSGAPSSMELSFPFAIFPIVIRFGNVKLCCCNSLSSYCGIKFEDFGGHSWCLVLMCGCHSSLWMC